MEPEIIINGVKLTDAQAMTVRVACASFGIDLQGSGLGDDQHSRDMTKAYLKHLARINSLLVQESSHAVV